MAKDKEMTIWEHIYELSMRLRVILISIFILTVIFMIVPADLSFLENPSQLLTMYRPLVVRILDIIREQVLPEGMILIGGEITAGIELYLMISFAFGLIFSVPIIAYEIYKYIDPALYPHERKMIYPFIIAFSGLFVFGAFFGYLILLPFMLWALVPFLLWVGAQPVILVSDFYSLVFISIFLSGISFTFPVFLVLLVKVGLLKTKSLTKNRRYVYAGTFILTAIITPDGGPLADLALFLPIILLFELAIYIAKRYEKEEPPKTCKFCGSEMEEDEIFCPKCGKSQM